MSENFYLGAFEYVIIYMNGTHHIMDIYASEMYDNCTTVFTGHYEECIAERKRMKIAYAESLF